MNGSERSELRGQTLSGRYRVGEVLGAGGTAVVFEADDQSGIHPDIVIKTLRPVYIDNPDLIRRLRREGEVARRVAHPGIVAALGEDILEDGSPFLVFERVRGECLARLLRRVGTLSPEVVGWIATRVASVLHAAHAYGYVHRDIKPEHIVMCREEDEISLRILDFGVCASDTAPQDERDREIGRVFGTPSYASPEQASGDPDVDARADVFGLGITMFEAMTGHLPFTGSNVANLLRRIIREEAPRVRDIRPEISIGWDDAVARSLARSPEDRFFSMRSLARTFAPLVGSRRAAELELMRLIDEESERVESVATRRGAFAA